MHFVLRLGLLYTGVFGALGVQLPFIPVWFAAKGFDAGMIGATLAAATLARVVTVPFTTRAADRFLDLKTAILASAAAGAVSIAVLGLASDRAAIALLYALAAAAAATTLPLVETYALHGLAARGRAYGPARIFGSAAFIAGTLAAGLLLPWIAPAQLVWLLAAAYALSVAAAVLLAPVETGARAARQGARVAVLLRDRTLLAVIAASALVQASHALFYGFGTLQWRAAGLSGGSIGALWSLSVAAEIVLFALSSRLPPMLGPLALLALGAAGAVLRWSGMALDPPTGMLPLLQVLHGLSFGATHLGAVGYVARAAPAGLAATAQGLLATANGSAMAAAMAVGGLLQASFGAPAYAAMALLAAGGGLCVLAARGRG